MERKNTDDKGGGLRIMDTCGPEPLGYLELRKAAEIIKELEKELSRNARFYDNKKVTQLIENLRITLQLNAP